MREVYCALRLPDSGVATGAAGVAGGLAEGVTAGVGAGVAGEFVGKVATGFEVGFKGGFVGEEAAVGPSRHVALLSIVGPHEPAQQAYWLPSPL